MYQIFIIVLIANAIWFALGLDIFTLRRLIFAKILIPKSERDTPVFHKLIATGPFIGGFNLAICDLKL